MERLRRSSAAFCAFASAFLASGAVAQPTTKFTIQNGNCYLAYPGLNDGVTLEIARKRNDKNLIFYVTNPIWEDIKERDLDIIMTFISLPKSDGKRGWKRFPAMEPVKVDAMALPPGGGNPGFAFVMSDEMASMLAAAGEQGLNFRLSQKDRDLTGWYYFSQSDLIQLNRCFDPFPNSCFPLLSIERAGQMQIGNY